jgi:hypothetical protein
MPHALVYGDERRLGLDRPVAASGMDVGVAQLARLDADLIGSQLGMWNLLEGQRLLEATDDGSATGVVGVGAVLRVAGGGGSS